MSASGRRAASHRKVSSSAITIAPRAEHAVAISARVARSSIDNAWTPSPVHSITRFNVMFLRAKRIRMKSISSLAVTFSARRPVSSKRIDSGTRTTVVPLVIRFAYSVVPTPHASALFAPSHASMAIRRLNKVTGTDHRFASHLVTDSRRLAILGQESDHSGLSLEGPLNRSHLVELCQEGAIAWHLVSVDEMILERGKALR